eukprot:922990-Rhodomonas_salina.1
MRVAVQSPHTQLHSVFDTSSEQSWGSDVVGGEVVLAWDCLIAELPVQECHPVHRRVRARERLPRCVQGRARRRERERGRRE